MKINSNNLNKYKKFLTYNGCNLICKKIINSSKTNILFSSKVLSNIDNKNKLLTLKNFELEKKLKPNYIGTFAVVDEEIL